MMATGFRLSSPVAMTQSLAFLSTPDRLCPYSGEAMNKASLERRAARQAKTGAGSTAALGSARSGLNAHDLPMPEPAAGCQRCLSLALKNGFTAGQGGHALGDLAGKAVARLHVVGAKDQRE